MSQERQDTVRHLKKARKKVVLRATSGDVYSIADFARRHAHRLEPHERQIIDQERRRLPTDLPACIARPLQRTNMPIRASECAVRALRAGGRSAYWKRERLHFKGCNPQPGLTFPIERLAFGSTEIEHDTVPFGCLSAEGVMREILAHCFLSMLRMPIPHTPICVFEYRQRRETFGYCFVSRRESDARTEERLDYFGLSIRDLIHIKAIERQFGVRLLKGDVGYRGLDSRSYADKKAKLLVKMNVNGGFRGILNSNLGNDILLGSDRLVLCDFDTFCVIKMPEKPSNRFLESFCLWCVTELVKTSTMVWDYLDLEEKGPRVASRLLAESFFANSQLWKAYRRRLLAAIGKRGWDPDAMERALASATKTDACFQMFLDAVPNSMVLQESYEPTLSLYVGHN